MSVMSTQRQAVINTLGNLFYLTALWLLTVITTRFLGYEAAGTLTLAMAVGNVAATVQVFGVRGFQSSDISYQYASGEYVRTRILTVVVGWLLGIVACLALNDAAQVSLSILLFLLMKSSETFSDVLFGNAQRAGHLELAGYSMAVRGILLSVLFSFGAVIWKNLNAALLCASIGVLTLSLAADVPLHNRVTAGEPPAEDGRMAEILKECFPLLLTTLIPAVISAFPRIVLERYYGPAALGYYGNVSTPALLLTTVIPTVLIALLPGYGGMAEQRDYGRMRSVWLWSVAGVIAATGAAMLGVLLLGKPVLSMVYTAEIVPYVPYLYDVLIAMMLYTITMCCNTVLVALRRSWGLTLTTVLALVSCLLVSVPLVRGWGIGGAIASLAIPYGIQALTQAVWIVLICRDGAKK